MRASRTMLTAHHGTPLVVRASLPRTFLGIGLFVEASLLFVGVYLLLDAWKRPLEARQEVVITAGVLLSLATVLLFYLARPKGRDALARAEDRRFDPSGPEATLPRYGEPVEERQRAEQTSAGNERLPGPM